MKYLLIIVISCKSRDNLGKMAAFTAEEKLEKRVDSLLIQILKWMIPVQLCSSRITMKN